MIGAARALAGNAELPTDLTPRSAWDLAQASMLIGNPDRGDDAKTVLERGAQFGSAYALESLGNFYELNRESEEAQASLRLSCEVIGETPIDGVPEIHLAIEW
jgi:hypothetical protein